MKHKHQIVSTLLMVVTAALAVALGYVLQASSMGALILTAAITLAMPLWHLWRGHNTAHKQGADEANAFVQRMIDLIPQPIYVKDAQSRFLLVNEAFARERECPASELLGRSSVELAPTPETAKTVADEDVQLLQHGQSISKEEHTLSPVTGVPCTRFVHKCVCLDAQGHKVIVGAHFDITELREAQTKLTTALAAETAHRQRMVPFIQRLIDVMPSPVYVRDTEGWFMFVNEAFVKDRGKTREAILSARAWAKPEFEERVRSEDALVVQGGVVYKEEHNPHYDTGKERFRIISKRACEDADGNMVIVGTNFDITPWRVAERDVKVALDREVDLRQRVQNYMQRLIDVIPQPVYVKNAEGRYLMVNEALARDRQLPADILLGRHPLEIPGLPGFAQKVADEDLEVLAGGTVLKEEKIIHAFTGQEMYRLITKGSCLDADGNKVIVGCNFNITEWRQAEDKVKVALEREIDYRERVQNYMQRIIDVIPQPVYVKDAAGRYLMLNTALAENRRRSTAELLGRTPFEINGDTSMARLVSEEDRRVLAGTPLLKEEHITHPDTGEEMYRQISKGSCLDADGRTVLVGCNFNITEWRQAELKLLAAKDIAERASAAKSQFLASMSHEIRTPLAGVIGTLNLALRDGQIAESTRKLMHNGLANAEALLTIINDILDFSKIEAGELTLESIDFDLRHIAVDSLRLLSNTASARSLQLIIDIDPKLPQYFKGDPTRLRQILINLVGNALKFTKRGSVALRAVGLGYADDTNHVERIRFRVEDTGIGIPEEAIPRLFGKFQQADLSTTRKYGGTGLGLAICRDLVQAMGGEIGVTSTLGVGTTFEFILPISLGEAPKQETTTALEAHVRALHILCAEDYETNQIIILSLLEDMGHHATMVNNGREAVQAASEQDFDVILMDGRMPEMDGLDATRAIRRGGIDGIVVRNPQIPIIALTANASNEDRDTFLAAGMNEFLTKPIELRKLHAALGRVVGSLQGLLFDEEAADPIVISARESDQSTVDRLDDSNTDIPKIVRPEGLSRKLHTKLIGMFAASIPSRIEELSSHIATTDLSALGTLAHGMRGTASMLGAQDIPIAARKVEDAVKSADLELALSLCPALQAELQRFEDNLPALLLRADS